MRKIVATFSVFCLALLLSSGQAGEKKGKEETVKGKITCAKCDLGVEKACATVIVTKKNGKDITLYFDAKGDKKYHAEICTESKPGSVTGVISEEGKKKLITVKSVKFD